MSHSGMIQAKTEVGRAFLERKPPSRQLSTKTGGKTFRARAPPLCNSYGFIRIAILIVGYLERDPYTAYPLTAWQRVFATISVLPFVIIMNYTELMPRIGTSTYLRASWQESLSARMYGAS